MKQGISTTGQKIQRYETEVIELRITFVFKKIIRECNNRLDHAEQNISKLEIYVIGNYSIERKKKKRKKRKEV